MMMMMMMMKDLMLPSETSLKLYQLFETIQLNSFLDTKDIIEAEGKVYHFFLQEESYFIIYVQEKSYFTFLILYFIWKKAFSTSF